jgi:hypothetical protein
MNVLLNNEMTFKRVCGRRLKWWTLKVNLLLVHSLPNGRIISSSECEKSVSERFSKMASLRLRKIGIISSRRRYRMLVNWLGGVGVRKKEFELKMKLWLVVRTWKSTLGLSGLKSNIIMILNSSIEKLWRWLYFLSKLNLRDGTKLSFRVGIVFNKG